MKPHSVSELTRRLSKCHVFEVDDEGRSTFDHGGVPAAVCVEQHTALENGWRIQLWYPICPARHRPVKRATVVLAYDMAKLAMGK